MTGPVNHRIELSITGPNPTINGQTFWTYLAKGPKGMQAAVVYGDTLRHAAANIIMQDDIIFDGPADDGGFDPDDSGEIAGAAEIEPKPVDGRRLENRVETLERRLEKHSKLVADVNNGYGGIRDQLTYLRKSHDALTATVEQQGRELTEAKSTLRVILEDDEKRLSKLAERVCELEGGMHLGCRECRDGCDCDDPHHRRATQPDPTTMRFDANGDDAKWEAVHGAYQGAGLGPYDEFKAAVTEAIRQGLVSPRIDPENEEQVRVVADCLYPMGGAENVAKSILSALSQLEVTHE